MRPPLKLSTYCCPRDQHVLTPKAGNLIRDGARVTHLYKRVVYSKNMRKCLLSKNTCCLNYLQVHRRRKYVMFMFLPLTQARGIIHNSHSPPPLSLYIFDCMKMWLLKPEPFSIANFLFLRKDSYKWAYKHAFEFISILNLLLFYEFRF